MGDSSHSRLVTLRGARPKHRRREVPQHGSRGGLTSGQPWWAGVDNLATVAEEAVW